MRGRNLLRVPIALSFGGGFVVFVVQMVRRLRAGRGFDLGPAMAGQGATYLVILGLVALAPLLVLGAWALSWWRGREERDFERKYLKKRDPP